MAEQNFTTETVLAELSKEILSGNQVGDMLNNPIEFPAKLIEELSLATALRYWKGQMTYSDADCIMNKLYLYCMNNTGMDKNDGFFGIAWECYLAFDAGEFYRDNDDSSIDPSEKYTRPLVESLLKKQKLIV